MRCFCLIYEKNFFLSAKMFLVVSKFFLHRSKFFLRAKKFLKDQNFFKYVLLDQKFYKEKK